MTGVQTCALPIYLAWGFAAVQERFPDDARDGSRVNGVGCFGDDGAQAMLMFLVGVASVMGLSFLGVLYLLWRAPLMHQADEAMEQTQFPSIDPAR